MANGSIHPLKKVVKASKPEVGRDTITLTLECGHVTYQHIPMYGGGRHRVPKKKRCSQCSSNPLAAARGRLA
jgi:hypothetical protein